MRSQLALMVWLGLSLSPASAKDLQIAVAVPITGSNAYAGEQIRRGAEAAAEVINSQGGLEGRRIALSLFDDACDPKQAVSVAHRIVAAGITLVDGHFCSGASIPASEVYAEGGALMMTPGSLNSKLTDNALEKGWPTIMRLFVRDDVQGKLMGQWLAKHYAGKRIAYIHDKTAFGKNLADQVKAEMNKAGLTEILYDGINPGEKDYTSVVSRLKSLRADVVYFGGYPQEAGLILRQTADQQIHFDFVANSSFMTSEFWSITGPAGEGVLFPFPADPRSLPSAKQAVARMRAAGQDPEGFTLFSYAVIQSLAQGT